MIRMPHFSWTAFRSTFLLLPLLMGLGGCSTASPTGITVVSPFDIGRYMGQWYEIARLDHSFERNMSDVSARYRQQPDDSVEVVNRGYDNKRQVWREAVGRALFVGDPNRASLKVSFFRPFYGGYHVVELDQQGYRWAMVVGPDRDYLWILARDKELPVEVRDRLLRQAEELGIDTRQLIWVKHTRHDLD